MILLQASICWSAGVASLVQSGPSWARDCARAGADPSAAVTIASIKIERRMTSPCIRLALQCFVAATGLAVQGFTVSLPGLARQSIPFAGFLRTAMDARVTPAHDEFPGISLGGQKVLGQPRRPRLPTHPAHTPMKNDEILAQISAFCRQADMAESTFGRRTVNDGKLVARLREGKRITIDTLDRIQAYIVASSPGGVPPPRGLEVPPEKRDPRGNFRFFENRQKYLLFVHTCSEKRVIAERVALELASIHPRPPALRVFDAGVGDGTVLARVLRSMHGRFPHMPFYIAGKELSLEDVRLTLEKVPDRLFEHPATVFMLTNMYYAEAPWLAPASPAAAASMIWHEVALRGASSGEFEAQIAELGPFLEQNWRANVSPRSGMPVYERPVAIVLYREDHRFLLDSIIPRAGRSEANFDLIIASQPYRAKSSVNFRAKRIIAPLARALRAGGRLIGIHSHGQDPGIEIIQAVWPGENPFAVSRHELLRAVKYELWAA